MYKNIEKVYVEYFADIDKHEINDNKLYILKYPHDKHYRKWIYNKHRNKLEPLTWLDKVFEYKHAPAKLDKINSTRDYIKTSNVNRTQADGLDSELRDIWQQHHLIDTNLLDRTLDELKAYEHVPGKLDKKSDEFDYIKVENVNRTQEDGLENGLIDTKQQHFILDTSKLDKTLNEIGNHVPSKLDKEDHSHTYLLVENKKRTQDDGLKPGLVDNDNQLHVINTKGMDDALDNLRLNSHAPGKIDKVGKDFISVKNENRTKDDGLDPNITDTHQQHFIVDTTKLDDELAKAHVPSKLDKIDDLYDYVTVKNENRTKNDGLPEGLVDSLQQHHMLDTSKLDLFLSSLEINNGMEVIIAGASNPDDDTSISLGDISKYNDIKVYYRAGVFSVTQEVNIITPNSQGVATTSFMFTNIGDQRNSSGDLTGEIGQVLASINKDLTTGKLNFYNSEIWRFTTNIGSGENGSFNTFDKDGNHMQPGGSRVQFGIVTPPHSSTGNRKGWIEIIKITGVVYGTSAVKKALESLVLRFEQNLYVDYQDFNRFLKYVISAKDDNQLSLLEHIEQFKEQLEQEPVPNKVSLAGIETYYDYLLEYREELKKGDK